MTYDPTIPKVTASPSVSAPKIEVNFSSYAAIFSRTVGAVYNHIAFNQQNQGKHAVVLMEKQTADPGVTQDLSVLFNKDASSALGIQPQLFAQIPKFLPTADDTRTATNSPMQITYNTANTAGPIYQSFSIGGYIIYFGSTDTGLLVTLVPTPAEILMVQGQSTAVPIFVTGTQPDKFMFTSAIAQTGITWMAIGSA
jgi:hypothetical protein